jgi:hypothetical protein
MATGMAQDSPEKDWNSWDIVADPSIDWGFGR